MVESVSSGRTSWKGVAEWASRRQSLELELKGYFPLYQPSPVPIGISVGGMLSHVSLPWNDREGYPFDAPHTGGSSHVLFLKFVMYAFKHGGDRVLWVAPEHTKTPRMSLFGVVKVLIPAADRKEYSALGNVFPLKCDFKGAKAQKMTLDKNLKQAGFLEFENHTTKEVTLTFDLSVYEHMRAQYQKADEARRIRRMAERSIALTQSSVESVGPMAIETLLVQSDVDVVSAATDVALLPSLSEMLGCTSETLTEVSRAYKRVREASSRVAEITKALQTATEEHAHADEHLRSVRARLCAE